MEVSCSEGLANHIGPESCTGDREDAGEALTGVRAGWVLSREINVPPRGGLLRGADAVESGGRRYLRSRDGERPQDPARSETPGMYASTSFGNREIPLVSVIARSAERVGRSQDGSRR
jgi:RNA-directed DNA polymerase